MPVQSSTGRVDHSMKAMDAMLSYGDHQQVIAGIYENVHSIEVTTTSFLFLYHNIVLARHKNTVRVQLRQYSINTTYCKTMGCASGYLRVKTTLHVLYSLYRLWTPV